VNILNLTGNVLFTSALTVLKDALVEAVSRKANLCGANLCGADLCGADLCGCAGTPLPHIPTVGHRGLAPWPQKVGRK
jgi:hypothetical protein